MNEPRSEEKGQELFPVSSEKPLSNRQEYFLPLVREHLIQKEAPEGTIQAGRDTFNSSYLILEQAEGKAFIKCLQAENRSDTFALPRPVDHLVMENAIMTLLQKQGLPVTQYSDFWRSDTHFFYTFPEYKGGALSQKNREGKSLTLSEYQAMGERVSSVLSHLHTGLDEHKCYYRDLNSGNILFDEDNNAYLHDFGNVALEGFELDFPLENEDGEMIPFEMVSRSSGSLAYLAPESLPTDKEPINNDKSEQFSLAVIMYESLTIGSLPYSSFSQRVQEIQTGTTPNVIAQRVSSPKIYPLRSVLEQGEAIYQGMREDEIIEVLQQGYNPDLLRKIVNLDSVFMRALSFDPDSRFESVAEFNTALQEALTELGEAGYAEFHKIIKHKLGWEAYEDTSNLETAELPIQSVEEETQEAETVPDLTEQVTQEIRPVRSENIVRRVIKALQGLR